MSTPIGDISPSIASDQSSGSGAQTCRVKDWSLPLYVCSNDCSYISQICTGRFDPALGQASLPPWPSSGEVTVGSCADLFKARNSNSCTIHQPLHNSPAPLLAYIFRRLHRHRAAILPALPHGSSHGGCCLLLCPHRRRRRRRHCRPLAQATPTSLARGPRLPSRRLTRPSPARFPRRPADR
jgi:hypothetical protein